MPGYLFHLAEGKIILEKLYKNYNESKSIDHISSIYNHMICKDLTNDFLFGCVLPDATTDKELTHFRPEFQKELITKYPDTKSIIKKYPIDSLTPIDLGILAHLHMDELYVKELWPTLFTFKSEDGTPTNVHSDISFVEIIKTKEKVPYKDFFTNDWFYGEYDILNPSIKKYVGENIPAIPNTIDDIKITECKTCDLNLLKESLEIYNQEQEASNAPTKILNYELFMTFFKKCADEFVDIILSALH